MNTYARSNDSTQPQSAIELLLEPGRYPPGDGGAPSLVIQERSNVTQLQIIARKDRTAPLAKLIREREQADGIQIYATGPLEYWLFSELHGAKAIERQLGDALKDKATLFDQSHARFVLRISGTSAPDVLAKGTPLDLDRDLDAEGSPAQAASHTMIEHIPALVVRRGAPACFDLSVPRSYAGSFIAWLSGAALEYNYVVKSPER